MQIVFETVLFCLALIAPALIATSFKSDSASHGKTLDAAGSNYHLADKSVSRWFGKRKRAAAI